MNKKRIFGIVALAVIVVGASVAARGAMKDNMTVTAGNSLSLNIQAFVPGQAPSQWFHNFNCVNSGSSLFDTLPITFQLDNARGDELVTSMSLVAHGNPTLAWAISFSPTAPFSVTAGGSSVTENIVILTGAQTWEPALLRQRAI
jgi:hypothetical protein